LKYASGGRCRCCAPARAGAAPPPWAGLPRALGPLPLLPPLPRWACAAPACWAASDRVGRE